MHLSRVVTLAVLGRSSDSSPTLAARVRSFWAALGRSCWRTYRGALHVYLGKSGSTGQQQCTRGDAWADLGR